jgi:HK97 family phage major capsid protein
MSYDTAYSVPTGLANNVDSPNYYDILLAAHTQVTNAYFRPTAFIMHPTNVAQLMTGKTSTAQYQAPPWVTMNGGRLMVLGLPVIANSGVTVNTFTVGDFKKINLAIRKDIDIRLWDQNSTDPIYGLKTITATMRAAQFASAQDLAALVTGSLNQTNLDGLASA